MQESKYICYTKEELSAIISAALDEKFPTNQTSDQSNTSDLLNIKEAADFLGYNVSTIYSKVNKREIPFWREFFIYFSEMVLKTLTNSRRAKISKINVSANSKKFPGNFL